MKYEIENNNLHKKQAANVIRDLIMYHYCAPVFEKLTNIPYAVIKGEVLSIIAYGEVSFRTCGDLDILIPRSYAEIVKKILIENGFERDLQNGGKQRDMTRKEKIMFMNSHQIEPYVKIIDGKRLVQIDINVDVFWGEYRGKRIDLNSFLADTYMMKIYNKNVKVLSNIKHFIVLCLHHYKEMNAIYHLAIKNPFNEKMFEDIYKLYSKLAIDDLKKLDEFVFTYQLEEIFYYILYYTNLVFSDYNMKLQANRYETNEGVACLDYYGLTNKERKRWSIPFAERMNNPNIFEIIKKDLSVDDVNKIDLALSI